MALSDFSLSKLPLAGKVGVGVFVLGLLGAAYYMVFYEEIATAISNAKTEERRLAGELNEAKKAEAAYQKDLAELAQREQRQSEFNKILPTTTEQPAFLSALREKAESAGIDLTAWSPNPEVPEKFYVRIPMKIDVVGKYHQIAKFFYGVGQHDRIINIENITISEPKTPGEDTLVKAEALATAFRSSDEALKPADPVDKRGAAAGAVNK